METRNIKILQYSKSSKEQRYNKFKLINWGHIRISNSEQNNEGFTFLPVKVSVQGLIPANRLEVPKSEIFKTPLYVLINTLSPCRYVNTEIFNNRSLFTTSINDSGKRSPGCDAHLNVSVDYLIVMKVFEPLEDLLGVEDDGGLIVFQRAPFGAQEGRQTSWKQECNKNNILQCEDDILETTHFLKNCLPVNVMQSHKADTEFLDA